MLLKPQMSSGMCERRCRGLSRDAYATSHAAAEVCTQWLAAGRGDGYRLAAGTAAAIARSPVHTERPSIGRQV